MVKEEILDAELQEEISIYTRISVDLEDEDDDNTSIENQLKIVKTEIKRKFPKCTFKEYIDRDRSGYTFEQRESYQEMRKNLLAGNSRIVMFKDFSRFSRRTSHGLVELEFLRDSGFRIISVMDGVDYPKNDDWLSISFRFVINEQPVTTTSKNVRRSIKTMQEEGEWLCAVPYGYILETVRNKQVVTVVPDEAEVIKEIFRLYAYEGWGYKKIANYLTDKHIPTPMMKQNQRLEEDGREVKRKASGFWSVETLQSLLRNDFYIGTYRGHKYTRAKINGKDTKLDTSEHVVIEKHHPAIIKDKLFLYTKEQLAHRTSGATHYRGIKKYDTPYTGYLFCGDCGGPMFSRSRPDLEPSYICGTYHKRGLKGCSAHHTRFDFLDGILKDYIRLVKENSQDMLDELKKAIETEADSLKESDKLVKLLEGQLVTAKEELKATKKQKIREMAKNPDDPDLIDETFAEIEAEIESRIHGIKEQLKSTLGKRSQIVEMTRISKTVFDVFDDILTKPRLDNVDVALIIDRIEVFKDGRIEVKLKPDITSLLETGSIPNEEDAVNFNFGSIGADLTTHYAVKIPKRKESTYTVSVVRDGEPLEIFTDAGGGVIFKKYSPAGEQSATATNLCESVFKTCSRPMVVCDRDSIIASSGNMRRELEGKPLSADVERIMESRQLKKSEEGLPLSPSVPGAQAAVVAPVISEGDLCGCVAFLKNDQPISEFDVRMAQASALFFARQMEN